MTTTQEAAEIHGLIVTGQLDDDLEQLVDAIKARRADIGASVEPGDKITVSQISPKYIAGHEMTVIRRASATKVLVSLDEGVGKFPTGAEFKVPMSCIVKLG